METYQYIYDWAEDEYLLIIDEDETDYRVRRGLHQNLFTCWNCDLQHSQG